MSVEPFKLPLDIVGELSTALLLFLQCVGPGDALRDRVLSSARLEQKAKDKMAGKSAGAKHSEEKKGVEKMKGELIYIHTAQKKEEDKSGSYIYIYLYSIGSTVRHFSLSISPKNQRIYSST